MIVTIDGPAGSGKSTAARKLAAMLGVAYLDTGAMYRAITLKALDTQADLADRDGLVELARGTHIELDCGPTHTRVIMDGRDVTEAIRSMRVSHHTNPIASNTGIRAVLVEKQRQIGRALGSLVTEGRDQGSVVFPDADAKFLLEACDEKRAERRYTEMKADGEEVDYDEVLANIRQRDRNDAKQWAPLKGRDDVIVIDTSAMSIAEVVRRLHEEVHRREGSAMEPGSA